LRRARRQSLLTGLLASQLVDHRSLLQRRGSSQAATNLLRSSLI